MANGIPEAVAKFLIEHIASIEQLEILLLLKSNGDRSWSEDAISQQLGSTVRSVHSRLMDLESGKFVKAEADHAWRYAADASADAEIALVAQAYRERRVSVINLILSKPSDTVRTFADAFRLRRRKDKE